SLLINNVANSRVLGEFFLTVFLLLVVMVCSFIIYKSGYASKREINDGAGIEKFISEFAMLVLTVVVLLRVTRLNAKNMKFDPLLIFALSVCVFYLILTGERDVFFRLVVCCMFVSYFKFVGFSWLKLLVFVLAVAFMVPLSQSFKSIMF